MKYLLVSLWLFGLSLLQGCGGEIVSSTTATPPSPPASLAITSSTPPSGTAGAAYAGSGFLLTASGGAAPYQWKWVPALGSSLPEPDLHLSPSGLISGTAPSGRNLRRYRYSYGCLVPGRPGKHQLFDCHRRPTDVRDYFGHSAERNSWSGLWPDDNRILELCLESGPGVAFGLPSVSLLRILCVPSALQRNFADALFAHHADLSRASRAQPLAACRRTPGVAQLCLPDSMSIQ